MTGRLLIRVDSNPEIASGHLMRCLSIAQEANARGLDVSFLMSDDCNRKIVEERGFSYYNLDTDWRHLDTEILKITNIIGKSKRSVILIDTYSVTSRYVNTLKKTLPVIYLGSKMEDIGQPDCIINYSSDIDYPFYELHYRDSELLLGVKFAPLRKEFQDNSKDGISVLTDVLLTTGGADKPGFSGKFLEKNLDFFVKHNLKCHVVVGSMFHDISRLEECANQTANVILHHNVHDMASLMKGCQLAVSANGTTVYELAACGIPTISFALVTEQESSGKALGKIGVVDYCGPYSSHENECQDRISGKLGYYMKYPDERIRLGQKSSSIIDGNGCEYIVDTIIKITEKWS